MTGIFTQKSRNETIVWPPHTASDVPIVFQESIYTSLSNIAFIGCDLPHRVVVRHGDTSQTTPIATRSEDPMSQRTLNPRKTYDIMLIHERDQASFSVGVRKPWYNQSLDYWPIRTCAELIETTTLAPHCCVDLTRNGQTYLVVNLSIVSNKVRAFCCLSYVVSIYLCSVLWSYRQNVMMEMKTTIDHLPEDR